MRLLAVVLGVMVWGGAWGYYHNPGSNLTRRAKELPHLKTDIVMVMQLVCLTY